MKSNVITLLISMSLWLGSNGQKKFDYAASAMKDQKRENFMSYKGKPLILELFSAGCIVCFKEMPRVSELQRKFAGRVNFVLLGNESDKLPIVFDRYKKKYSLSTEAYFDSALFKQFNAPFTPYYIWIDEKGVIRGEGGSEIVTESAVDAFGKGRYDLLTLDFKIKRVLGLRRLERSQKEIIGQTGFYEANDSLATNCPLRLSIDEERPFFRAVNCPLGVLMQLAWLGQYDWNRDEQQYLETFPFVEVTNGLDSTVLEKLVSYSMEFNRFHTQLYLQEIMKQDIQRTFRITAEVREEMRPCIVIRRVDTSRNYLRTVASSQKPWMASDFGSFEARNVPFNEVLKWIEYTSQVKLPVVDKTRISWGVDMSIKTVMTDWDEIARELENIGLKVSIEIVPMQVLKVRPIK